MTAKTLSAALDAHHLDPQIIDFAAGFINSVVHRALCSPRWLLAKRDRNSGHCSCKEGLRVGANRPCQLLVGMNPPVGPLQRLEGSRG